MERDAPDQPTAMHKKSWWAVLKRRAAEFKDDGLADWQHEGGRSEW
ncbi:hypothetical protein ACFYXH_06550 [Streptomyces sp. NPDC002730]